MYTVYEQVQNILYSHGLNIITFLLLILEQDASYHPIAHELLSGWRELLVALCRHRKVGQHVSNWVVDESARILDKEITDLAVTTTDWHFTAEHTEPYQLQEFDIADMANDMRHAAPCLWRTLDRFVANAAVRNAQIEYETEEYDDDEAMASLTGTVNPLGDESTPSRADVSSGNRKRRLVNLAKRRNAMVLSVRFNRYGV